MKKYLKNFIFAFSLCAGSLFGSGNEFSKSPREANCSSPSSIILKNGKIDLKRADELCLVSKSMESLVIEAIKKAKKSEDLDVLRWLVVHECKDVYEEAYTKGLQAAFDYADGGWPLLYALLEKKDPTFLVRATAAAYAAALYKDSDVRQEAGLVIFMRLIRLDYAPAFEVAFNALGIIMRDQDPKEPNPDVQDAALECLQNLVDKDFTKAFDFAWSFAMFILDRGKIRFSGSEELAALNLCCSLVKKKKIYEKMHHYAKKYAALNGEFDQHERKAAIELQALLSSLPR